MTLIEILKAKGIRDDIITAVQDEMKANKIFTSAEENMDVRYGKQKTQHEAVTKERDEAKALIESLQKSNNGNEDLHNIYGTFLSWLTPPMHAKWQISLLPWLVQSDQIACSSDFRAHTYPVPYSSCG